MTCKDQKDFEDWLDGRPEVIKEMAATIKPWHRYRVKTTGQRCTLYSFSEDKTVTIEVDGHDSAILNAINRLLPMKVFGVNPDDLELLTNGG